MPSSSVLNNVYMSDITIEYPSGDNNYNDYNEQYAWTQSVSNQEQLLTSSDNIWTQEIQAMPVEELYTEADDQKLIADTCQKHAEGCNIFTGFLIFDHGNGELRVNCNCNFWITFIGSKNKFVRNISDLNLKLMSKREKNLDKIESLIQKEKELEETCKMLKDFNYTDHFKNGISELEL